MKNLSKNVSFIYNDDTEIIIVSEKDILEMEMDEFQYAVFSAVKLAFGNLNDEGIAYWIMKHTRSRVYMCHRKQSTGLKSKLALFKYCYKMEHKDAYLIDKILETERKDIQNKLLLSTHNIKGNKKSDSDRILIVVKELTKKLKCYNDGLEKLHSAFLSKK